MESERERTSDFSGEKKENFEESGKDGNDWHKVRNRKDKGLDSNIYISNLPFGFNSTKLWKAFSSMGELIDAYVPMKKNELGKKFGFLRFKKVYNEELLVRKINGTWLEGLRVQANVSRYRRDSSAEFKRAEKKGGFGNEKANPKATGGFFKGQSHFIPPAWNNSTWGGGGRSFRDVTMGINSAHNYGGDTIHLGNNTITGLSNLVGRAFIGEVKDLDGMAKLVDAMKGSPPVNTTLRYVGGLKILLSFRSKEDAASFLDNKDSCWGKWFMTMTPWDGSNVPYDRIAWITIKGIPIQAWSSKTSNTIGARFGKVVIDSIADVMDGDLSEDRVAVLVNSVDLINCKMKLVHKGKVFEILVKEDGEIWKPEFINDASLEEDGLQSEKEAADPDSGEKPVSPVKPCAGNRKSRETSGAKTSGAEEAVPSPNNEKPSSHAKNDYGGPTPHSNRQKNEEDLGSKKRRKNSKLGQKEVLEEESPTLKINKSNSKIGSPTTSCRKGGPSKRKRAETSGGRNSASQSDDSGKKDGSYNVRKKNRKIKIRLDLNKKGRKISHKKESEGFIEEEINSWNNEELETEKTEDDWQESNENEGIEDQLRSENMETDHDSDSEVVKETAETVEMGKKLGIELDVTRVCIEEKVQETCSK